MPKIDQTPLSNEELEDFFRAAVAQAPEPGGDLVARIIADAEAEIAARTPTRPARSRRPGLWKALVGGIGGWPALASMATAAVAGIWLGVASPDQINTLAGGLLLSSTETMTSDYEFEDLLPGYAGFEALVAETN